MRYIIQIIVMLSDILIVGCGLWLIFFSVGWEKILGIITLYIWYKEDGFIAWTHHKQFLKNAKKLGL